MLFRPSLRRQREYGQLVVSRTAAAQVPPCDKGVLPRDQSYLNALYWNRTGFDSLARAARRHDQGVERAARSLPGRRCRGAAGGAPLTPGVAATVLDVVRTMPQPRPKPDLELSPREREVLTCLVDGLSYKQVAHELEISLDTVRTHIRRLYGKLRVHSVAEAVSRALREGLVD